MPRDAESLLDGTEQAQHRVGREVCLLPVQASSLRVCLWEILAFDRDGEHIHILSLRHTAYPSLCPPQPPRSGDNLTLTSHPFPVRIDINNQPSPHCFFWPWAWGVGEVLVN